MAISAISGNFGMKNAGIQQRQTEGQQQRKLGFGTITVQTELIESEFGKKFARALRKYVVLLTRDEHKPPTTSINIAGASGVLDLRRFEMQESPKEIGEMRCGCRPLAKDNEGNYRFDKNIAHAIHFIMNPGKIEFLKISSAEAKLQREYEQKVMKEYKRKKLED